MADGVSLQLKFGTMSGEKTWTFRNAKSNISGTEVEALAQAIINNGSIYKYQPLTAVSAKVIVTTENEFDVSGVTPAIS